MAEKIVWSTIHGISLKMAELAQRELWEELVEIERERNVLIQEFFEQGDPQGVTEQDLLDVLEIDKLIMEKCMFKRKNIGEKLRLFNNSRRAKNAYMGNR